MPDSKENQGSNIQKLLSDKKKTAIIAAAVLAVIVLIILLSGRGGKALPGGVHLGDSYNTAMKAARSSCKSDPIEQPDGISFYADLYGYDDCYVGYVVSKSEPLSEVGVVVYEDSDDSDWSANVINKLIKEYGKPTREETDENGYTNYYWEFNNLEIKAQCVIDVYIYFYKPDK